MVGLGGRAGHEAAKFLAGNLELGGPEPEPGQALFPIRGLPPGCLLPLPSHSMWELAPCAPAGCS